MLQKRMVNYGTTVKMSNMHRILQEFLLQFHKLIPDVYPGLVTDRETSSFFKIPCAHVCFSVCSQYKRLVLRMIKTNFASLSPINLFLMVLTFKHNSHWWRKICFNHSQNQSLVNWDPTFRNFCWPTQERTVLEK